MTTMFITIAYDPASAAEGDEIDLFEDLRNVLDDAGVVSGIVEFDDVNRGAAAAQHALEMQREQAEALSSED